jgi:hypothetical protein
MNKQLFVALSSLVFALGCQQPVEVEGLAPPPAAPEESEEAVVHAVQGGAPSGVFPAGHPTIDAPGAKLPPGHPPVGGVGGEGEPSKNARAFSGRVQKMEAAGRYQYLALETDAGEIWTAVPAAEVAIGDVATVEGAVEMVKFHSKTLDRTFDSVWFGTLAGAPKAEVDTLSAAPAAGDPTAAAPAPAPPAVGDSPSSQKPIAINRIYKIRSTLQGKPVLVKGKVVKFNGGIMDRNWVHLQDGTGDAEKGTNDLLVTTDAVVEVGSTVSFRGIVVNDKNFGFGYQYDVLVEQAQMVD